MSASDNLHQTRMDPSASSRPKMISILKKTKKTSSNFPGSKKSKAAFKMKFITPDTVYQLTPPDHQARPKLISILKKKTTTNTSSGQNMAASNMKSITPGSDLGWGAPSIPLSQESHTRVNVRNAIKQQRQIQTVHLGKRSTQCPHCNKAFCQSS